MSHTSGHAQVSLHPVASRHGAVSSTVVPVKLPSAGAGTRSPRAGSMQYAQDPFASCKDGQGTPRLHPSSPAQTASRRGRARSPSPKSLPSPAQSSEPPSYGIQHADLDEYPVISDEPLPSDSASDEDSQDEDSIIASVDDTYSHRASRRLSKQSLAAPIRAMSAAQLASLHEQYMVQDVPHNVVFPFLHGVDGSIPAQNAFFGAPASGQPTPRYRGLTILRADMPSALEMARIQASRNVHTSTSSTRARARTFSSVTTQSSGSSPDTDDGFEASWNGLKVPNSFGSDREPELVDGAASTASVSASTASTVSSQTSRPSLFSVASGSFSAGSRTSVSTESDVADEGPRPAAKGLLSTSPTPVEPQPRHSILNSTVFPDEIIQPPTICRTVYGRNIYSELSESSSWGDEEEATKTRRIGPKFVRTQQASGVSLRNFKIQCAKYATISDIVIYCPFGYHSGALLLAKWVREAQATLRRERLLLGWGGLEYNVFIVTDAFDVFEQRFTSLVSVDSHGYDRNRVDFVIREREEMERMTRATEIHENVWLGCTADAPGALRRSGYGDDSDPPTPDEQGNPQCFSVCINCEESVSPASGACDSDMLRNAAQYLDSIDASMRLEDDTDKMLGSLSRDALLRLDGSALCEAGYEGLREPEYRDGSLVLGPHGWTPKPRSVAVRTDPSASHFISSRAADASRASDAYESGRRGVLHLDAASVVHLDYQAYAAWIPRAASSHDKTARKLVELCVWIQQQAMPSASSPVNRDAPAFNSISSTLRTFRDGSRSPTRSFSPNQTRDRSSQARADGKPAAFRRPRRVLLHCPDGYTETSMLALSYLMFTREQSLATAYLDLQLRANRSFFVYPADIPVLEAVDRLLQHMRAMRSRATQDDLDDAARARRCRHAASKSYGGATSGEADRSAPRSMSISAGQSARHSDEFVKILRAQEYATEAMRPSLAMSSPSDLAGGICRTATPTPRKNKAGGDVQAAELVECHAWFDKTRFDGSFPSRILPFVYLGNLDHASNVDMLRVLGITHLVSVGETALAPPDHISAKITPPLKEHGRSRYQRASAKAAMAEDPSTVPSITYESQGVTVLNVRNVSDDGIDSLRGTMREAVQFIEAARLSGGKVLVHCRVGVSRSTTIVLAYIMAHLDLGLVESYLLVRSRRLNIVIQPHLLFLWELRGWETFLFKAKQAQISLVRGQQGSPDLRRGSDSREASTALSALSLRSGSGRSDEGSGSYKSAWSSPASSPRASHPLSAAVRQLDAASAKDSTFEHHLPGVEIGAGAGSIHGFDMAHSATMPFGSGSPSGLSYSASRLTWGHLAREISELNSRYFV